MSFAQQFDKLENSVSWLNSIELISAICQTLKVARNFNICFELKLKNRH